MESYVYLKVKKENLKYFEPLKIVEQYDNINDLIKEQKTTDEEIERAEQVAHVQSLYDEWLQKTEKRGISYGELAYIQGLDAGELAELEKELLNELENGNNEEKTN